MANEAKTENYEEMIAAVSKFISDVSEASSEMTAAGNQCVEQCDNDEPSTKANAKLNNCVRKLDDSLETARKIQEALQKELEQIYETLRAAEELESD